MGVTTAQASPSNFATQLSANDQLGTVLGGSPTDLVGFWGGTGNNAATANAVAGVVQPSGNAQSALVSQPAGTIFTWSTTQSPSAVANITSGESTFTVQSGTVTNAANLIATTDLVYVNKPTAQAGLGYGNARASAANSVAVTFINPTAATLTPTTSEVYKIVSLRGIPAIAATLTPAAVAPNVTVEQLFTVTPATNGYGLPAGQLVQVSKAAAQAGLDIVGCRVAGNNQVGITFANVTAATITPTAGESYTIWALPGLDAFSNMMGFQFNAGTIGAIGAGLVITGGATAVTGVLATDIPLGPAAQPTAQAAATNAAVPALTIASANALTMYFSGIGSGATPTASLPYNQAIYRQNPVAPLFVYSQSLAPTSVAPNTCAEQTFTVTGLIAGTPVYVNKPSWQSGLGIAGVRVSATNTLAINYINTSANTLTPATETYVIGNFQVPAPGAGNCVYQTTGMVDVANTNLSSAMRAALVNTGFIRGS